MFVGRDLSLRFIQASSSTVLSVAAILVLGSCSSVKRLQDNTAVNDSASLAISQSANQEIAPKAINKLWSANENERQEGINTILALGDAAVEPLDTLLKDLLRDPRPRFPTGKEK